MALTANREVNRYVDQELRSYRVLANAHVFKGSFVGVQRSSGFVRPLASGDAFAGLAYEESDNSGGANGARSVRVFTQGDFILEVTGATATSLGRPVFASGDDTLSLAPTGGLGQVGTVIDVPSDDVAIVRILPFRESAVVHQCEAPLSSLTSAATTNPVLITAKPIIILSAEVVFNTKPDAGALDVGTDNSDPDEIVDGFSLAGLTNNARTVLTLAGSAVAKDLRIWAKVGPATSTAGVGGLLTLRYIELP